MDPDFSERSVSSQNAKIMKQLPPNPDPHLYPPPHNLQNPSFLYIRKDEHQNRARLPFACDVSPQARVSQGISAAGIRNRHSLAIFDRRENAHLGALKHAMCDFAVSCRNRRRNRRETGDSCALSRRLMRTLLFRRASIVTYSKLHTQGGLRLHISMPPIWNS